MSKKIGQCFEEKSFDAQISCVVIHSDPAPMCDSNPCQNGGTCVEGCSHFACNCGDNLPGDLCENSK